MLKLLTWEELEARACGDKIIETDKFKKMTKYYVTNLILTLSREVLKILNLFKDFGEFLKN